MSASLKPLLLLLIAWLALAACTGKPGQGAAAARLHEATPTASPAPAPAATPRPASTTPADIPVASAATDAMSFEFAFSSTHPDGKEGDDPRILRWEDGPCGGSPIVRVSRMPLEDPALLPDYVVEFDDTGKELKRWGKPYEAEVLGFDGDLLRFRVHGDQPRAFWTDLQGHIGTIAGDATSIPDLDAPTLDCPALPTFSNSDYTFCSIVTDTAGRPRKVAWEGPCT